MKIRAVIVDVYKTLLEVLPPTADRPALWARLWRDYLNAGPPMTVESFSAGCEQVIQREHAAARARGIPYPEIYWPDVALEVAPPLRQLSEPQLEAFLHRQAQTWHTVRLLEGAADGLRLAAKRGLPIGIASNAQPYTLRELAHALAPEGLDLDLFAPDLCFWSFAHGFSKPDPHVFRLLAARLRARGIAPAETLMVGDREDNDLTPARSQGWQTWQLRPESGDGTGGPWTALMAAFNDGLFGS